MEIRFFDEPFEQPKPREDVRIKIIGLFVYEDRRRVAIGFDITPFLERPSIEVKVINAAGDSAGEMTIVDTLETSFTLTMHLRDQNPTNKYKLTATLYYSAPDTERMDVHQKSAMFDVTQPGEQLDTSQKSGG